MGDEVVHGIYITLAANLIPIENIHCRAKTRNPLSKGIILGGLPFAKKGFMG
jgi:hypothetical protein